MILDTDFVIDVMRKEERAIKRLKDLVSKGEYQIITAPTLFELSSGISQSEKKEEEKQKILDTLSNLIMWHLDKDGAEKGGEIDGKLVKQGQKIDPIDSMIAGITLAKRERILTRNVKHFSRIAGLRIETY